MRHKQGSASLWEWVDNDGESMGVYQSMRDAFKTLRMQGVYGERVVGMSAMGNIVQEWEYTPDGFKQLQ